jgi:prepilin-type N-terminal cleavage/methylation domain-containing protein
MKKGFTLIEVVVVIGIIAVLTVIIFPAINNIRAKNRDAEKVADISAIQLGLALYKNQQNGVYPNNIYNDPAFAKYVTTDTLTTPEGGNYLYVPLTRDSGNDQKCTYYHLGVKLELPSGQIDTADTFDSITEGSPDMNNYKYCDYDGPGIAKPNITEKVYNYNVHP